MARNGNIYNIWTLGLKTGELRQYTDAVGGNLYAVVVNDGGDRTKIAFVSYYKANYELHMLERREPIVKAALADFGEPGAIIPFQAPLSHTLIADNKKKKGTFEKLFLDGRPPVNVGVTSGGDVFGGSSVTFSDVLGDQQFNLYAASISQYRTLSFSYLNLARRFNYAVQAFSQTTFFYGNLQNVLYDGSLLVDRDLAQATRTIRGGTVFGIWPFNRYRRVELFTGFMQYEEQFNDPSLGELSSQYQQDQFGRQLFRSGNVLPLGINFVEETTVFREFGPLAGRTMRLGYEYAPKIGDGSLSRQTMDADVRYYQRLGGSGLLALRARGFKSWGDVVGLPLLWRQLRDARLRVPGVHRRSRELLQCGAALPAHRSDADAARACSAESEACCSPTWAAPASARRPIPARAGQQFKWMKIGDRSLYADRRLRPGQRVPAGADLWRSTGRQGAAAGRRPRAPTASAWRRLRSASPCTSTGHGGHC